MAEEMAVYVDFGRVFKVDDQCPNCRLGDVWALLVILNNDPRFYFACANCAQYHVFRPTR